MFQMAENVKNKSTEGVSKAAYVADFLGTLFCLCQLQLDSVLAGYSSFFVDPHFNVAKTLIAIFGLVNSSIILAQIVLIYPQTSETCVKLEGDDY